MRARPVLYPFLIAAYPILALYAQNAREVPLRELTLPIGVALACTLVVWACLWAMVRDAHRAGLLAVLGVALFAAIEPLPGVVKNTLDYLSWYWVKRGHRPWPWLVTPCSAAVWPSNWPKLVRPRSSPTRW